MQQGPTCCSDPQLGIPPESNQRYEPPFIWLERCATCGAYWRHTEDSRWYSDGREDSLTDCYVKLTDVEASEWLARLKGNSPT
jgi:hypothetical protein